MPAYYRFSGRSFAPSEISLNSSDQKWGLLTGVATRIAALSCETYLRVAVDGVDGAGKSTFANELALALQALGRPTIRASVDGFHNPRAVRYRRGRNSPDGFYLDSYDYTSLRRELLEPFCPMGAGRYRPRVFDHVRDMPTRRKMELAVRHSVLILDGIFLHRPELRDCWDLSIFLVVPFEISIPRGAGRGADFGSPDPNAASNRRYIDGQRRYLRECEPEKLATVTIDNSNLDAPYVVASH
jgi:uridine kinase